MSLSVDICARIFCRKHLICRYMCAVGASSVEVANAISGIQTREATLARLASGWAVSSRTLPD
ncbi:MAG: hypothetical protein Q9P44_06885 [Anaerolineae bacterium]|nr:hypothetical protein [Anaerolineae bacterium]